MMEKYRPENSMFRRGAAVSSKKANDARHIVTAMVCVVLFLIVFVVMSSLDGVPLPPDDLSYMQTAVDEVPLHRER